MTYIIDFSPLQEQQLADVAGRAGLEPTAYIKRIVTQHLPPNDPKAHVAALLAEWQAEDHTPTRSPFSPIQPGETDSEALFRSWEEEDARMTEAERHAEDQLWAQIEADLLQNSGLRLRNQATP